jgi:hypothetical protein
LGRPWEDSASPIGRKKVVDDRSHEVIATRIVGRDKHAADIVIELTFTNSSTQTIRMKETIAHGLCVQIASTRFGGDD